MIIRPTQEEIAEVAKEAFAQYRTKTLKEIREGIENKTSLANGLILLRDDIDVFRKGYVIVSLETMVGSTIKSKTYEPLISTELTSLWTKKPIYYQINGIGLGTISIPKDYDSQVELASQIDRSKLFKDIIVPQGTGWKPKDLAIPLYFRRDAE